MMCKPWVDAMSQRVLLRRSHEELSSGDGNFLAKWDKPSGNHIHAYCIIEGGIASC